MSEVENIFDRSSRKNETTIGKFWLFGGPKQIYHSILTKHLSLSQVCSSSFVTEEWILASYGANVSYIWPMDVRTVISAYAQFLQSFCTLSQWVLAYALKFFLASPIVTAQALPSTLLNLQVDAQFKLIQSSGPWILTSTLTAIRLYTSGNQLLSGLGTNIFAYIPAPN
jgi:hypothetical protein